MKKLLIITMLLLCAATVSAETTLMTADLSSVDGWSTGTVAVRVLHEQHTMSTARATTDRLPYIGRAGYYELWFGHSETGYMQSGGIFPSSFTRTVLTYIITDDLSVFDTVMITQELNDDDPRPGEIVMIGALVPKTRSTFFRTLPRETEYIERGMRYWSHSLGK